MSVYYCIPSKRPPEEAEKCLKLWRAAGYKIALWRDSVDDANSELDWVMNNHMTAYWDTYPGYSVAVNTLALRILRDDPQCDWIVTGGDDVEPDANHSAEEIARQCSEHFLTEAWANSKEADGGDSRVLIQAPHILVDSALTTFGVMQPTGDRFAGGSIDRICGSPWLGRSWCERINQGRGPLWPDYTHCFGDEELQNVALKYGVLWQRPDLIHLHRHYQRESDALNSNAVPKPMPDFLKEANSPEHWRKYQTLFRERKAAGFPGSEPL
jgi:hypothetical protein